MHYDYSADECILNSIYELENVLSDIKSVQEKIDFYKDLKKFRIEAIDKEIDNMKNRETKLRSVILENMKRLDPKKKTLDFPAVGKITRTAGKKSWVVDDEQILTSYLKTNKLTDAVIEIKEVLSKKRLDALLKETGQIPGVSQKDGTESISITFAADGTEDAADAEVAPKAQAEKTPEKVITEMDL